MLLNPALYGGSSLHFYPLLLALSASFSVTLTVHVPSHLAQSYCAVMQLCGWFIVRLLLNWVVLLLLLYFFLL